MMRQTTSMPAYFQIASIWIQTMYSYRVAFFMDIVGTLLKIYLLKVVWVAVYGGRATVDGIPLDQVISFVTLTSLQLSFFAPMLAWYLRQSVREGGVATELARPVPYLGQLLAHQAGFSTGQLLFLILATPFALVLGGMLPPASFAAGVLYLISMIFGYIISTLIGLLIGLVSFWTTETGGVQSIYDFISSFFAGALVPLWFFPPLLRGIGQWLPFEAQAFIPLQIYSGQISGSALFQAFGLQLTWIIILGLLAYLIWQRAFRRLVIQGG